MKNSFLQPWFKLMAKQLSKPHGILASLTGRKMNESNHALYRLTFDSMNFEDEDKILEIGFGNGMFFQELNSKAKNLQITGIDLSHEMVTQAVKNNAALFDSGNMKVKVGNSDKLPFENDSFDKIFCINVIYFWEIPEVHLQEINRVLKPGGIFYTGFRPAETMLQLPFTKYGFNLYTENDWTKILQDNNFSPITSTKLSDPLLKPLGKQKQLDGICIAAKK
jgi:ubiquinone/menaquinone biosynthesis C-methylase UbiE